MKIPTVQFIYDRKKMASGIRKGVIEMRITYNRIRKHLSTGVAVFTSQWDDDHEKVVNSTDAHYFNNILAEKRNRTMKIITRMVETGKINLNEIPALLKQKDADTSFIEYIFERMQKKQVSESTKKAYHVFFVRFSSWGKMKFFSDINEKGIRDFDEYLHAFRWKETDRFGNQVERKYSQPTIGAMHKNLKLFINDAIIDGHIDSNPYVSKRIRIDNGKTRIDRYLTKDEIEKIKKAKMPTRTLDETRDLFLMQASSGMSYIDLMSYDFTKVKDKEIYSVFSEKRHKTGVEFSFVLTPQAVEILEKYNYSLPKTTNQQYNVRLKIVADTAGIDKSITSHDARRSCGYLLLNAGVPIAVVSRVLGHSSIKMTESAYARLLDDTISQEIKKHIK